MGVDRTRSRHSEKQEHDKFVRAFIKILTEGCPPDLYNLDRPCLGVIRSFQWKHTEELEPFLGACVELILEGQEVTDPQRKKTYLLQACRVLQWCRAVLRKMADGIITKHNESIFNSELQKSIPQDVPYALSMELSLIHISEPTRPY